jgi:hypothetical protein
MLRLTYKYRWTTGLLTIGWVGALLLHQYYWRNSDWLVWVAIVLAILALGFAFAEGPGPNNKKSV